MLIERCRSCLQKELTPILDLGEQPWCNDFRPDIKDEPAGTRAKRYPLRMVQCDNCELLQLDFTVPKRVMFAEHDYVSGTTRTLYKHFSDLAKENIEQFGLQPDDLIVDIGGNDGTQMLAYELLGCGNLLNVESAWNIAQLSSKAGIPTINKFFDKDISFGGRKVKLFNASGVFFHLEDLHGVTKGIKINMDSDGVFVVQCMYAGAMADNLTFDMIYHEHLCYYTLRTLEAHLKLHGLKVFDAYLSPIHSGSLIAKVQHEDGPYHKTDRYFDTRIKDGKYTPEIFHSFADQVRAIPDQILRYLKGLKDKGLKVYGYGAAAKGSTLLNYCNINSDLIPKVVEVNPLKINKLMPGSGIPIVEESEQDVPDYYFLLSHNFLNEIVEKNHELMKLTDLKFITPLPSIYITRCV